MNFIPLTDDAARQVIDSTTLFQEVRLAQARARPYAGGMYWKRQGDYEYLAKTRPDNGQQLLGRRSLDTEKIFEEFTRNKTELESRLRSLSEALALAERMNKAVKAGRTPPTVVAVLQALEGAGLGEHFVVVGTHALYAYETAAGVRIESGALATMDVDLLRDARRRVQFVTDLGKLDASMLQILRRADRTFQRKEGHNETAINAKGLQVDFLRREPEGDDPHPFRFSADEEDLSPIQARRATVLTNARKFERPVIASTGRMALMRTVEPRTFVEFKRWMAEKAPDREAIKRRRDLRQADIVQAMLDDGLLAG